MNNVATKHRPAAQEWRRSQIKAALEDAGWTLRRLSLANGYTATAATTALQKPWPALERIIADAISAGPYQLHAEPWEIWPSRYNGQVPKSQSRRRQDSKLQSGGQQRRRDDEREQNA